MGENAFALCGLRLCPKNQLANLFAHDAPIRKCSPVCNSNSETRAALNVFRGGTEQIRRR